MKHIARFFLLIAILVIGISPELSFAQAAAGASQGSGGLEEFMMSIENATTGLVNQSLGTAFFETIKNAALTIAAKTNSLALTIAGALAVITLIWKVMLAMLSKDSVVLATLETLILSSICFAVITQYSVLVNQIYNIADGVLSAIGMDLGATLAEFVKSFFGPVAAVYKKWTSQSSGWLSMIFSSGTIDMFGTVILTIAIIVLLLLAMVNLLGVFIMGPIFFGIGIVFGPLMIATIVSDYTRQWFGNWLNFMVGSAFLTTVAVAVVSLLTEVIGATASQLGSGGSGILAMVVLTLLAATTSKIFESVPRITDAIFPGRTGASMAINKSMVPSAVNATKSAAGAAMNPVSTAKAGAMSAARGMGSAARAVGNSDAGKGVRAAVSAGSKGASMGSAASSSAAAGSNTHPNGVPKLS